MKYFFFIALLATTACKQAYEPPVLSSPTQYLVVEGFINSGPDSTYFNLTHTTNIRDTAQPVAETNAQVFVEGSNSTTFPLTEVTQGRYGGGPLALNAAGQYRIHIKTKAGKEYVSDYSPLRISPPIDSISWTTTAGSDISIFASTHDPSQNSRYYRWEYDETWELRSAYQTSEQFVNGQVIYRPIDSIYTCWQYDHSTNILLGSSAKLAQDEIYLAPLLTIPNEDWRLDVEYSILVRQYTLTQAAYAYWKNLQQNSEQIGTIFGPLPAELRGNVHNIADTSESVVGYVSAGSLQQKRIFIFNRQLSTYWLSSRNAECTIKRIPTDSIVYYFGSQGYIPLSELTPPGSGHNGSTKECVDCTTAGYNIRPSYWQ
jgi:Domain of unknown function (DUF4249)